MRKLNEKWLPVLAVLVLVLVAGLYAGSSYAKNKQQVMVTGTLDYYNRLAETFELKEHRATAGANGVHANTENYTQENSYTIIPGIAIPEDPTIFIIDKSGVHSALFIEVNGEAASPVDDTVWEKLDSVVGPDGGDVYVYTGEFDTLHGDYEIPILKDAEPLSGNPSNIPDLSSFNVRGYLIQVNDDTMSPAELFEARITN